MRRSLVLLTLILIFLGVLGVLFLNKPQEQTKVIIRHSTSTYETSSTHQENLLEKEYKARALPNLTSQEKKYSFE